MKIRKALAAVICFIVLGCATAGADEGYSQNLAKAARNFLTNFMTDGAKAFTFDKQHGVFRYSLNVGGEVKYLGCLLVVGGSYLRVYATSPVGVDPKDPAKLAAMAEFICRANYGMFNGNFELDFSDGEIRFKSFIDCSEGLIPSNTVIENSVILGVEMFKRYSPGIRDVLFNGVAPKEAFEKCTQ